MTIFCEVWSGQNMERHHKYEDLSGIAVWKAYTIVYQTCTRRASSKQINKHNLHASYIPSIKQFITSQVLNDQFSKQLNKDYLRSPPSRA